MKRNILVLLSFFIIFTFTACTNEPDINEVMNYDSEITSDGESAENKANEASEPHEEIINETEGTLTDEEAVLSETDEIITEEPTVDEDMNPEATQVTEQEATADAEITASDTVTQEAEASDKNNNQELPTTTENSVSNIAFPVVIPEKQPEPTPENTEEATLENCDYVLNTSSKKIHYPNCSSVGTMAPHNTKYFIGTRDQAVESGYKPCGRCKP